jgi:hypothetical protein
MAILVFRTLGPCKVRTIDMAQENGDGRCASSWVCAPTLSENLYRQDGGDGLCLR